MLKTNKNINSLLPKKSGSIEDFCPSGKMPANAELLLFLRNFIRLAAPESRMKLPPLRHLSACWKVNYFTVQQVTETLVRENLLYKHHGKGIYLMPRQTEIRTVGIYYSRNTGFSQENTFYDILHEMLCRKLHEEGIRFLIWNDLRPEFEQKFAPEYITNAIVGNEIQGIIGLKVYPCARNWFFHLPTRIFSVEDVGSLDNRMLHDTDLDRLAETLLAKQFRRIAVVVPGEQYGKHRFLIDDLKARGVKLMPRYQQIIEYQERLTTSFEELGYRKTLELLSATPRPDALIVFPDHAARGAIQAVLRSGIKVPDELFTVFHRNVGAEYFCSFPTAFLDVRIAEISEWITEQIRRCNSGEATSIKEPDMEFTTA